MTEPTGEISRGLEAEVNLQGELLSSVFFWSLQRIDSETGVWNGRVDCEGHAVDVVISAHSAKDSPYPRYATIEIRDGFREETWVLREHEDRRMFSLVSTSSSSMLFGESVKTPEERPSGVGLTVWLQDGGVDMARTGVGCSGAINALKTFTAAVYKSDAS
ncbi:MAG: hypothetical protein HYU80_01400 [Candidatus Blackburnbacteria bacterium]|nr:hypothetical protein [Candidatus Blackburnbacteria bacterium]